MFSTYIKIVGIFFLSTILSLIISAQSDFGIPRIITTDDGLPSNYITAITKDNEGFMWFGTDNGLCRWDGISAKVFQHNEADSNSIASGFIEPDALLWDDERKILFIGTSGGLSVYNPISGKFRNYYPGKGDPLATGNRISAIIKDNQGIIWIATDNGFARYNKDTDSFKNYYYKGEFKAQQLIDTIKVNTMLAISQDLYNDSVFWIGTRSGLLKFNKFTEEIRQFYYDYLPKNIEYAINIFRSVCPHPNGKLYLGTWTCGMTIFCVQTETFIKNFRPSGVSEKKSNNDGTNPPIKVKSEHEIWLTTVLGLSIYDTETDAITSSKSYKNPAGRVYPIWINLIDESKRLWCGSRYGVYVFDPQKQQFENFFFKPSDNLKSYITWDIFEDTITGLIYMAVQDGDGLHYFDPDKQQFAHLKLPVNPPKEVAVTAVFQTSDGKIWIVCGHGLYQLSKDRKTIKPVIVFDEDYPWLRNMVEDKTGNIWVSSSGYGLQRVNLQSAQLEEVKNWRDCFESDRNVPDIQHLQVDKYNRIWFIRQYGGYGYYDIENDSVCYFFRSEIMDTGFYHLACYAEGNDNIIWAGDWGKGLGYIDPDSPEKGVQSISTVAEGILNNTVYNIRCDNNDRLWMLTRAGLEMYDPATGCKALFNQYDGIITYDTFSNRKSYIPGSFEKLSDGRMAIGYRRGLGFFHPDSLVKNEEIPIPFLTSLKVFEKELNIDTALFYAKHIDLSYKQNFLTLEYSAISLTAGRGAVFYHQLEGIDRDWVQSKRRFASYSNLAPGYYTFHVKLQTGYKLWSEDNLVLYITIFPPWWKTWWAYSLYFLAITVVLISLYRFQLNRQLAVREAKRLKELDEIKSQLYANITHEFRTPLTVITGMTDEIKSGLKPGDHSRMDKFLDMIKRNAGNLLHLVNQMLDLSKIESGMLELNPIQADVIPYLKYITESFQSFADSKGIKLVFYNEREAVMMDYDPDKLFTIISNLLSNAIKFTDKGGKVICHINTSDRQNPEELVIKVTDTGIGIQEEMLPMVFSRFFQVDGTSTRRGEGTGIGLSLVKELVELMNGKIAVKSQLGKGCEFTVRLPVTHKARKQISQDKEKENEPEFIDKRLDEIRMNHTDGEFQDPVAVGEVDYPLTLIIEDNKDVAKYIALCLGNDYIIHHAEDGSEGIDKAVELIPDIIICDVMMPEKDGFEVCSFLKHDERTSHIPIIMLTAKAGREDRLAGLMSGADAYLAKPFDKTELSIRMKKIIELRKNLLDKFSKTKDELKSSLSTEDKEDLFLHKAIGNIENNINNSDFGTLQLAHLTSMSESQLYRKLKALTGKSTAVFIRSVRLQKAKELLKTTDLNVSEIAYETGFNDPAWFSRVFKEEFGEAPGTFRDNLNL